MSCLTENIIQGKEAYRICLYLRKRKKLSLEFCSPLGADAHRSSDDWNNGTVHKVGPLGDQKTGTAFSYADPVRNKMCNDH